MTLLDPETRDLAVWRDDTATLRAQGADADAFLQGQFSNDLRLLTAPRAQLTSWSSAKGRMLALFTLRRRGDAIELELPRALLEPVAKRLKMFVLRSQVTLAPSPDAILGLIGPNATDTLARLGLSVPQAVMDVTEAEGIQVLRRVGAQPRYSLHGPREVLEAKLAAIGIAVSDDASAWTLQDVLAGVPQVLQQTQDHVVAQMANLDQLGGISFDKGCYTGQEIVARLHYLGQLKRRMFLCTGEGPAPEPGSDVHKAGETQAVGEVLLSAPRPQGGFVASVVLQLSQAESAELHVGEAKLSLPQAYTY